jgi:LuxR family maltose regulon positive regulatory protein
LGARAHIAWIDMVEGSLHDAQRGAEAVIEDVSARGWTSMLQARYAYETLAGVNDVWGNHDVADRYLTSGYAADIGGVEAWTTMALGIIQASIAVSRNRPKLAVASLKKAQAGGRGRCISPALRRPLTRVETDVAILVGDLGAGTGRGRSELLTVDESATSVASRSRLCLARGDLAAAETLARRVPRPPGSDRLDDVLAAVEAWLVLAQVAHQRGDLPAARSAVRVALELARPQRILRPFLVLLPNGIAALTRTVESLGQDGDEFVAALLDALARTGRAIDDRAEPEPLVEPLTERELAILAELPSMSSNDEIAARYYVSVNTIKSHLKHLYRKLDVTSRREAVRRGRELGLIS